MDHFQTAMATQFGVFTMALPDSHTGTPSIKVETDVEGNYASTAPPFVRRKDRDQGLTLPPKIQSTKPAEARPRYTDEQLEALLGRSLDNAPLDLPAPLAQLGAAVHYDIEEDFPLSRMSSSAQSASSQKSRPASPGRVDQVSPIRPSPFPEQVDDVSLPTPDQFTYSVSGKGVAAVRSPLSELHLNANRLKHVSDLKVSELFNEPPQNAVPNANSNPARTPFSGPDPFTFHFEVDEDEDEDEDEDDAHPEKDQTQNVSLNAARTAFSEPEPKTSVLSEDDDDFYLEIDQSVPKDAPGSTYNDVEQRRSSVTGAAPPHQDDPIPSIESSNLSDVPPENETHRIREEMTTLKNWHLKMLIEKGEHTEFALEELEKRQNGSAVRKSRARMLQKRRATVLASRAPAPKQQDLHSMPATKSQESFNSNFVMDSSINQEMHDNFNSNLAMDSSVNQDILSLLSSSIEKLLSSLDPTQHHLVEGKMVQAIDTILERYFTDPKKTPSLSHALLQLLKKHMPNTNQSNASIGTHELVASLQSVLALLANGNVATDYAVKAPETRLGDNTNESNTSIENHELLARDATTLPTTSPYTADIKTTDHYKSIVTELKVLVDTLRAENGGDANDDGLFFDGGVYDEIKKGIGELGNGIIEAWTMSKDKEVHQKKKGFGSTLTFPTLPPPVDPAVQQMQIEVARLRSENEYLRHHLQQASQPLPQAYHQPPGQQHTQPLPGYNQLPQPQHSQYASQHYGHATDPYQTQQPPPYGTNHSAGLPTSPPFSGSPTPSSGSASMNLNWDGDGPGGIIGWHCGLQLLGTTLQCLGWNNYKVRSATDGRLIDNVYCQKCNALTPKVSRILVKRSHFVFTPVPFEQQPGFGAPTPAPAASKKRATSSRPATAAPPAPARKRARKSPETAPATGPRPAANTVPNDGLRNALGAKTKYDWLPGSGPASRPMSAAPVSRSGPSLPPTPAAASAAIDLTGEDEEEEVVGEVVGEGVGGWEEEDDNGLEAAMWKEFGEIESEEE